MRIGAGLRPNNLVHRIRVAILERESLTVKLFHQLVVRFVRDDLLGLAGELAFRFFLAIFPFFIFVASLGKPLASFLGWPNPAQRVAQFLSGVMPPDAAVVFQYEVGRVIEMTRPGILPLSLAGALLVATGAMNAFIKAANRAYSVEETRPFWRRYLTAVFLTVCAGVALIAAFAVFVVGWWFGSRMAGLVGLRPSFNLGEAAFWPVVGLFITSGISVLYWAAPNVRLRFRWALPGALVFTVAWLIATSVFARYVDDLGTYGLTYGTLAGVVVLLLWFYLTALLLLVGIEISALLAEHADHDEIDRQQRRTRQSAAIRQLPPRSAGTMTPGHDVA